MYTVVAYEHHIVDLICGFPIEFGDFAKYQVHKLPFINLIYKIN